MNVESKTPNGGPYTLPGEADLDFDAHTDWFNDITEEELERNRQAIREDTQPDVDN